MARRPKARKPRVRRAAVRPSPRARAAKRGKTPSTATLAAQLDLRTRERDEALEQQTATSEVLRVIAGSPGELAPVFNAMLANAVRICEAKFGFLYQREADGYRAVAKHNAPAALVEARKDQLSRPPPDVPLGRVAITKQAVQIADIKATKSYSEGNPFIVASADLGGYRSKSSGRRC